MLQKICITVGLALVLAGCAGRSSLHQAAKPVAVPVLHQAIQSHVIEGETQRADVVAAFGYPSSAFQSDSNRTVWHYSRLGYAASETPAFRMHQVTDPQAVDMIIIYADEPLQNTVAQIQIWPLQ
ncbi:MAG: hypothetical protein CMJ93_06115 [Planctomycetes bacterium]|nr:hypothetical protein [Planctomycetota bacterium]